MTSSKLLLVLMAAAVSMAAPQINEGQVVENVITQLGPAIVEALSSFNLGGSSATNSRFSSSSSSAPVLSSSRFSSSSVPALSSSRFSTGTTRATQSSFRPSTSSSSASASSLTSSVISSLQPAIAAAVAEALGQGSRRSGSSIGAASGATAEPNYGPAQYDFSYKVADDDTQTYIAQQENRADLDVTGSYNYVDPTGSLITVNYQAGPEGYSQTKDVERGTVVMRNIPVGWDGPLAGVDEVQAVGPSAAAARTRIASPRVTATRSQDTRVSQSDLITQILSSLQPQISSAVQSALFSSSNNDRVNINTVAVSVPSPAVQRPIPAPVRRPIAEAVLQVGDAPGDHSITGLFGVQGENSVRIETPDFNVAY